MLNVACVLKTGRFDAAPIKKESYTREYVYILRDMVRRHLSIPHDFVCLTNETFDDVDTISLKHDFPGWWSKIELFRPGLFDGPVLYFDLDTVIIDSLDDIAKHKHRFTMLRDFGDGTVPASGVMAWDSSVKKTHSIYAEFLNKAHYYMGAFTKCGAIGDQALIGQVMKDNLAFFQDLWPKKFVSYKLKGKLGKPDASVVCFHGNPMPHQCSNWIKEHFKRG